jgi:coproporphyrinogen III oxidase-like Fe-S oxidoreductase
MVKDHLVEEISKRVANNEEAFFVVFFFGGGTSYLNPASLLNITPGIVDRLLNT